MAGRKAACRILGCLIIATLAVPGYGQEQPNIILIMADDLGAECFADYGGQDYSTPRIEQLGNRGLRFNFAFSQPVCTPSRVQIMTGRYNHRNYQGFGYLDPSEVTFANLLADKGYETCIAGKWQLSGDAETVRKFGFQRHCMWNMIAYKKQSDSSIREQPENHMQRYADPVLYQDSEWIQPGKEAYGPDVCTDFIVDFIKEPREQPFLVYYPMILTHDPFVRTPDSEMGKRDKKENFQDMVAYADKLVGRIVDTLDETGLRNNTLIIFTGDNGTHRSLTSATESGEYPGGKSLPNNRGTWVPLYVSWPDVIESGTSDALVDFSDILPTLVEAAGAKLPENRVLDGKSLLSLLKGETTEHRDSVFFYYWARGRKNDEVTVWVRNQRFMLYQDGRFFDLDIDPKQESPVIELSPEQGQARAELQEALSRRLNK